MVLGNVDSAFNIGSNFEKIEVKEYRKEKNTILDYVDKRTGKINNSENLRRIVFIRDGKVIREKKFSNSDGFTLQMVVFGNRIIEVQLIKEAVYNSNYNQMFFLGRFRKNLFDEINNSFPFSRLYKIKF